MNKKHRDITIGRREFLQKGSMAAISLPFLAGNKLTSPENYSSENAQQVKPEWRNKQDGMVYRQLGRTGFMVSELVFGTERITPENVRPLEVAFERGVNYFDTAYTYSGGAKWTGIA